MFAQCQENSTVSYRPMFNGRQIPSYQNRRKVAPSAHRLWGFLHHPSLLLQNNISKLTLSELFPFRI